MATKTRRVGAPCVTCGRPTPVSGVPVSAEALEKLQKRADKLNKKLAIAAGITTKEVEVKEKATA